MITRTAEVFPMQGFYDAKDLPVDPQTGNPMIQKAISRPPKSAWRSRAEPLRSDAPDGPLAWSLVRDGDIVLIRMLPYKVSKNPSDVILGIMEIMHKYLDDVPNAVRTHMIIGDPFEEFDDHFRFWLGFAAQLK